MRTPAAAVGEEGRRGRAAGRPLRVLILGGGFGGVAAAQELERLAPRLGRALEVTLVSQDNYLLFVPMLPEAAAASLELTHILCPLRSLLPHTLVRVETVQTLDLAQHTVTTVHAGSSREYVLEWDYLVIALGNVVNLAGMPGVAQHGLPIKTIGDALHIRNRALEMLDGAEAASDPRERRRMLSFVVAGGGFSGVELAAELNDFVREAARRYHRIHPSDVQVVLIHSGQRILPELSADMATFAQRKLERRGVEIRLGVRLTAATAEYVALDDGQRIDTSTLVVAVGAATNPVLQALDLPTERGRLKADKTLLLEGQTCVWAVGDCAAIPDLETGRPCPPTAQFALRQGKTAARNVAAAIMGQSPQPFAFTGLGQMASLGHRSAVAELWGRIKVAGLPAWLIWRGHYLLRLPGLERKLRVWLDWNLDLLFPRDISQLNVERTQQITVAHYEPGQTIVRQGERADSFFVIVNGEVQVTRTDEHGATELARLGAGESFGEVGLLKQQRRNATVSALTSVDVIALGRGDFDLLAGSWKHLASVLERTASQRESSAAWHTTTEGERSAAPG